MEKLASESVAPKMIGKPGIEYPQIQCFDLSL